MSNLSLYQFKSKNVRTIYIDGIVWFVLADVLAAIESKTTTTAAVAIIKEDLGDGYVINQPILDSLGREQNVLIINESAVTFLIARSRTELGKRFNRWIHSEVLPSIRRTGQYSLSQDALDNPATRVETAHRLLDSIFSGVPLKPELLAGLKLNIAQRHFPTLKPDLEEGRQLLINGTAQEHELLTPTEIGSRLGISGQAVNKRLVELGFQVKNSDRKSRKEPAYLPTGKGSEFSDLTLASGKGDDKTTYQQLRWYSSILCQI